MNVRLNRPDASQLAAGSPLISFDKVSVTINQSRLLDNVNLDIPPGCWMGVVGPNGGGKSTLVKAILGLVPHKGLISLNWPGSKKGNIGYVPQLAPFDPTLPITVLDYLRMVLEDWPVWLRYKRNNRIAEMMAQFEITEFSDKRIGTLSTGERQRVLVCGALLNKPDVLFLDEPLAGVDKHGQQLLLSILQAYHQQGHTIVMVEHHWHIVEHYCQRAALIDGTLVDVGDPDTIFEVVQKNAASLSFPPVK